MAEFKDVEDLLVWAFRDQRVEAVASSLRPMQRGFSSTCSVGQVMALGTRVDTSTAGAMFVSDSCHEDAAVTYYAVMALPPEAWVYVIKHARTATEPYWHPEGPGEWIVPLDRAGNPKRRWRDPVRQRGDMGPLPAELHGTHPTVVEESRAITGSGMSRCASWCRCPTGRWWITRPARLRARRHRGTQLLGVGLPGASHIKRFASFVLGGCHDDQHALGRSAPRPLCRAA